MLVVSVGVSAYRIQGDTHDERSTVRTVRPVRERSNRNGVMVLMHTISDAALIKSVRWHKWQGHQSGVI